MNKKLFLTRLTLGLKAMGIEDVSDIIKDYEGHFLRESEKGKTEAEIARELGDLDQILKDYETEEVIAPSKKPTRKLSQWEIMIILDVSMALLWITLYSIIFSVFMAGIAFVLLGIYYVLQITFISVFPVLPTISLSILYGVSFIAIGLFQMNLAFRSASLSHRATKRYVVWHKSQTSGIQVPFDSVKKSKKTIAVPFFLGTVALILMVATYVLSAMAAESVEFWHIWGWFQ
jgi:uncharacterized membrane protein